VRRAWNPIGFASALLCLLLCVSVCEGSDSPDQKIDKARTSYSIAYQVGSDFKRQGVDIDPKVLLQGIQDAISGHDPVLTRNEMREVLIGLQDRIVEYQKEKTKKEAEKNLVAGLEFLAENGRREGVVTLPSGLQYEVITKGSGKHPGPEDTVTVRYRGTLIDGSEFDSSLGSGNPATFRADHVIPGWKEALPLMTVGAKWRLFVPPALGYGGRRNGRIGPNSTLIFEIELIGSKSQSK
jgi:FKBP-type peptidyl-prolyl cis-trans isomerase FklB